MQEKFLQNVWLTTQQTRIASKNGYFEALKELKKGLKIPKCMEYIVPIHVPKEKSLFQRC